MTTMIAEPPPNTTLGVGFENRRRAANPEAWKKAIGTRPVAARLALLPEDKPRWDRMGVSALGQFGLLFFVLLMPLLYPNSMKTALNYTITEIATPVTMVPTQPPPPPPPKVKAKTPPPPVVPEPVKLNPKQQHIFITPKAALPQPKTIEAKAPELNPQFDVVKMETTQAAPKRPREEVKLNNMQNSGSAAPATVKAPVEKVQTGGFGDEHGLPANKTNPNRAVNMNALGSPALPSGPGYGNGTGGAKGARGTVASSGFGNGTAVVPEGGKKGTLQSSGFSNQTVATDAPKKKAASSDSPTTSVDILDKPRPEYTAEGRSLKIEGDVVLDVVFLANGSVQLVRVVSGLGHGLDEAAQRAAQQIKFKPAKRDGQPVDFPARVRITFQLAY